MRMMFLFLLFLCIPVNAAAQDERKTYIGFKGGVSIPQLSGGDANELSRDFKSRVAPNLGGFVDIGITDRVSVQAEINYAGQGGKRVGVQPITQPIPGLPLLPPGTYYYGDFKNTAELNYLEFPVLAKYRFGSVSKPRIYVNGGAFYGRILSAKTKTKGMSTIYLDRDGQMPVLLPPAGTPFPEIPFDATTDIKNEVNANNFGFTGGAGVEIPNKGNILLFDVRVSRGIVNIQRDTAANGSSKTGNLVISVGYAFGIN